MNQKRSRSVNWDEEEKQLLRSVLKEYSQIIENKCIDTNTNKVKAKAWDEVYKKFNELNGRHRQLSQLKIQWKMMKVHARKTYSTFQKEASKTGGGARPASPNDAIIEIKDLLNPAELLRDHNLYDSDEIIPNSATDTDFALENTRKTCAITLEDSNDYTSQENQQLAIETIEDIDAQLMDAQKSTPLVISNDKTITTTPIKKNMGAVSAKKVPKRKVMSNISENGLKSRKDHDDYVSNMISHSKMLKEEEHRRRMEMAEEEHSIKIAIQKEKLKCAILEREILELKKAHEEKNLLNL